MNLIEFQNCFHSEEACLQYLEDARWHGKPQCPHCKSKKTYKFADGRLYKCGSCLKQFTVTVGTIFSDSKLPLYKWFLAIYLSTALKKGISSMQLSRYISVTQKTAWFMLQRIRYALHKSGNDNLLHGAIEINVVYVDSKNKSGVGIVCRHDSPKHLQKYSSLGGYRDNTRNITDFQHFMCWFDNSICHVTHKRFTNG